MAAIEESRISIAHFIVQVIFDIAGFRPGIIKYCLNTLEAFDDAMSLSPLPEKGEGVWDI